MRLTEKVKRPELTNRKYRAINTCCYNSPDACANKLGQLEDIEEELGIELVTLFKTLKNGCFAKETFNYMGKIQTQIIFTEFTYFYYADDIGSYFIHIRTKDHYLKDYGKTWALTKEELESEEKEMIKNGLLTDKPQF